MHCARLASDTDLAGFRAQARALLARQVPPAQVRWQAGEASVGDLFGEAADCCAPAADPAAFVLNGATSAPVATVPASFLRLCEKLVLHSDPARFDLLYRLLWRLAHEPGLRHDPLDADMLQAHQMARAVQRDMHKMKAFVRFRKVQDATSPRHDLHVAWFEPAHHIVEAVAPWFAARFTQMRWAILTPRRSAAWDGRQLAFAAGARASDAPPADAGEALWLTYYQSIFNPARLKLQMMQKEMPRKYWHNLPEARLIAPLAAQAQTRAEAMVQQPAAEPARRIARITRSARITPAAAVAAPVPRIDSLALLAEAAQHCRGCPIGACATQAVAGEGPVGARLMVVGEQPGDQEDLLGRPFVGPAGQLFDRALAQLGVPRAQVYVTNAVKHFKYELRGKRRIHKTASQREAAACLPWLEDEIRLVRPAAVVALGATAARALLGRPVPVTAEHGRWLARADGLQVLVCLHPSALLRLEPALREAAYAQFVADLSRARPVLAGQAPQAAAAGGPWQAAAHQPGAPGQARAMGTCRQSVV